jgi:hypothetical protein
VITVSHTSVRRSVVKITCSPGAADVGEIVGTPRAHVDPEVVVVSSHANMRRRSIRIRL